MGPAFVYQNTTLLSKIISLNHHNPLTTRVHSRNHPLLSPVRANLSVQTCATARLPPSLHASEAGNVYSRDDPCGHPSGAAVILVSLPLRSPYPLPVISVSAKMPEYRSHHQKAHCDSLAADQTPSDPGDAPAAADAGHLKDAVTAAPLARAPATAPHGWTSRSSAVPLDPRQGHRHPRLRPGYLAHRVQGPGVPAPAPPPVSAASMAQTGRHNSPALDPSDD